MLGIYLTAGHPNIETSKKALRSLDNNGVELIEIGVPFSDPLADGPVIQKSSFEALQNGVNLDSIFEMVSDLRNEGTKSKEKKGLNNVILFSYFNPLFVYGFEKLIEKCKETGIRGALIPDLPIEEAEDLSKKFSQAGLDLILLVAVTSTKERIKKICELSNPWIYLVSRTGVTGAKEDIKALQTVESSDEKLKSFINQIKGNTNKQVAVGFGIDSKEKVQHTLSLGADMAIIGSKTVKLLDEEGLESFTKFISNLN